MRAVNINDQKVRCNNMRQGEREPTSEFKTCYDNQVKANEGIGIVSEDDNLAAIIFLSKLDPNRFTPMLTVLRNNVAINVSSYPTTLSGAYSAASIWTSDGPILTSRDYHSAFAMEKTTSEKSKPSNKEERSKWGPSEKKSSADVECFVCTIETSLFASHILLLDKQSSANVVSSKALLTDHSQWS